MRGLPFRTNRGAFARGEGLFRERIREGPSVGAIARLLKLDPRTLIRRYQAERQISPKEFLERLRLEYATSNLSGDTNRPLPLVAERSGFKNEASFRRWFKIRTGLTPKE
jgi:transcriptional regulator GlxA family with amidase domain